MGATTAVRAVRLAVLLACSFILLPPTARADAPSGYACPPGVPAKGVGCTCPNGYKSKRDDSNIAICAATRARPPVRLGYDQLLSKANSLADSDCKSAEGWYARALKARPKGLEALVGSGMCFIETRKWASAHSRFRTALAIDPRYEGALWGVAEAYSKQGRSDDAVAAIRQYLDIYPSSYKAKAALDRLTGGSSVKPVEKPDPWGSAGPGPARTQDIAIGITGTRITVNGRDLSPTPMMTDIVAIFGKPDRVWSPKGAINQVHTWDKLGVIAYEPMDGRCISLTMPFRPMSMAYDPKTMFGGAITVDGGRLSSTTTLADARKRPGASQPYGGGSVVFVKGAFNVFTNAKNSGLDLVEISMWKQTKATTTASTGKPARTADMRIIVSGTQVSMNGVSISGKPMLTDLEVAYGKADRVWDRGSGNRVHTWDRLGLIAYEPRDGRVISATFPFKAMGAGYDPKTMFGGSIVVDGLPMGPSHDIDSIKARRGATQPYTKASVVFDKGDIHVFTIGKGAGNRLDLVEISFWQRDKRTQVAKPSVPASTTSIAVSVSGTNVLMNGHSISGKPMVADIEAVFGKADRVWETKGGVNRIHIWEKLGVLAYEPYDGRCISVTFPYKPMGSGYDPKTMFGGSIVVDGNSMTRTTTLATVKRRPGATTPYGASSIVFDKGDIHVFTLADNDSAAIELVEISFWQRNKK